VQRKELQCSSAFFGVLLALPVRPDEWFNFSATGKEISHYKHSALTALKEEHGPLSIVIKHLAYSLRFQTVNITARVRVYKRIMAVQCTCMHSVWQRD